MRRLVGEARGRARVEGLVMTLLLKVKHCAVYSNLGQCMFSAHRGLPETGQAILAQSCHSAVASGCFWISKLGAWNLEHPA